jgi:hypothetical protein
MTVFRRAAAIGSCAVALAFLAGCKAEAPSYPFEGSWLKLGSEDVVLVLEPDGSAVARGELPQEVQCPGGGSLWESGRGHWAADTDGRVLLYLPGNPDRALPVEAKSPFGSPSWTTIFVGVCGKSSTAEQYIEMHGKTSGSNS